MSTPLPARPSLEQLKKQAKDLLSEARDGDPVALQRLTTHHPAYKPGTAGAAAVPALHDAQLVVAREHGFPSWPRLREETERLASAFEERVKRFISDALHDNVIHHQGERKLRARHALDHEPQLATASLWTRFVTGDADWLADTLRARPDSILTRRDGPSKDWLPLHYVCFSRLQMQSAEAQSRFVDCARQLLDAGADPNASFEHQSWPGCPLRPLYGACGENNNPRLARLLLERGAMVNDGESIYHAAEHNHVEVMELLLQHGASLGVDSHWGNTPLYFLFSYAGDSGDWPTIQKGVQWLLEHGANPNDRSGKKEQEPVLHAAIRSGHSVDTIRMLLDYGADFNAPRGDGQTPLTMAMKAGARDIVQLLLERGATVESLSPTQAYISYLLLGDQPRLARLLEAHPQVHSTLNGEDRLALVRAAEQGNTAAIPRLLDAGFDIAYKGDHPWGITPLHGAAWHGWADAVDVLLAHGAPVDVPANEPESSTPIVWAAHGSGFHRNPAGDYPRIIRSLLAAGGVPDLNQANMASPEAAEVLHAALAGRAELSNP
ncbi:MAG: ankyrin repeat domain-containing protein [Candidatus Methylacidiphilales bacterium]